MAVTTLQ